MLACALFVTACGSDAVPALGQSGPIPNIVGRTLTPGRGGTGGSGLNGGVDGGVDGGVGAGACDNPADLDAVAAANLNAVTTFCTGLVCLITIGNSPSYEQCVNACVERNVQGLSSECADCYGGVARCGLDAFCLSVCQFNTCGLQCLNCLSFVGCLTEFEECRGLPGDGCDGGRPPLIPITDAQ
jgi:hypothetical protein